MSTDYDVIVVGGRCTGASSAMLLARAGLHVLMLDRDAAGSDMMHSTHFVQPVAVSKLKKWGLLPALEALCPGFNRYEIDFDGVSVAGSPPAVDRDDRAFCPRRERLDAILVAAAREAGADCYFETKVTDVVVEDGSVARVRTTSAARGQEQFNARLVIGADGPGSTVAKAVGAAHYHEAPAQQVTMWGYWTGEGVDNLNLALSEGRGVYAGPTTDRDFMVGVNWVIDDFKALRPQIEQSFYETVENLAPELGQCIRASTVQEPFRIGSTRNFLRYPFGPGWVLLGDAGHKKDPCTAQGITDAFNDVDSCIPILASGLRGECDLSGELADWHRLRDARLVPFHEMTIQMAKFAAPTADELELYRAIRNNPSAVTRFLGLVSTSTDPATFFAPDHIQSLLDGAGSADASELTGTVN